MKKFGRKTNKWVEISRLSAPMTPLVKKISRFALLQSVWLRETGRMAKYWDLKAVRGGTVYVTVKKAAASQELDLRKNVLLKSLNKYFTRSWIKQIKQV